MSNIECSEIRKEGCSLSFYFRKEDHFAEMVEEILTHINEIHDPGFVPKCKDDLFVEYGQEIKMIRSYFDAMLD